jgi:hypothetical protein
MSFTLYLIDCLSVQLKILTCYFCSYHLTCCLFYCLSAQFPNLLNNPRYCLLPSTHYLDSRSQLSLPLILTYWHSFGIYYRALAFIAIPSASPEVFRDLSHMLSLHFPSALTSSPSSEQPFLHQKQQTLFSGHCLPLVQCSLVVLKVSSLLGLS